MPVNPTFGNGGVQWDRTLPLDLPPAEKFNKIMGGVGYLGYLANPLVDFVNKNKELQAKTDKGNSIASWLGVDPNLAPALGDGTITPEMIEKRNDKFKLENAIRNWYNFVSKDPSEVAPDTVDEATRRAKQAVTPAEETRKATEFDEINFFGNNGLMNPEGFGGNLQANIAGTGGKVQVERKLPEPTVQPLPNPEPAATPDGGLPAVDSGMTSMSLSPQDLESKKLEFIRSNPDDAFRLFPNIQDLISNSITNQDKLNDISNKDKIAPVEIEGKQLTNKKLKLETDDEERRQAFLNKRSGVKPVTKLERAAQADIESKERSNRSSSNTPDLAKAKELTDNASYDELTRMATGKLSTSAQSVAAQESKAKIDKAFQIRNAIQDPVLRQQKLNELLIQLIPNELAKVNALRRKK